MSWWQWHVSAYQCHACHGLYQTLSQGVMLSCHQHFDSIQSHVCKSAIEYGQQKWTWKVIRSRWERIVLASDSARANNSPPTHSGKISNRMKLSTKTRRWHLNGNTSRMLTIMAGKLQRRKTMTTQRSILASPSSRAWLLKGSFILGFVSDVTKQNDIFICPHQW